MQFEHAAKIVIKVESSNLKDVLVAFLGSLSSLFGGILSEVMLMYASEYEKTGKLGEILGLSEGDSWHWKSKKGYGSITINTLFGKVKLPNPVVGILRKDGKKEKMVIGRKLLEVSAYTQVPDFMKEMLGSLGGLMSFRTVAKSMKSFGIFRVCLSSIWRSVGWTATRLGLVAKASGCQDEIIEVDGTGVSTLKSGKRGSEAKIVMQRKAGGGLTFLGVKVGKYGLKTDWEALLSPLKTLIDTGKRCILVADGDDTSMNAWKKLGQKGYVFCQRCLWHIPHQLKYMLWKDKASKEQKINILTLCYSAFRLRKDCTIEQFADYIALKMARIDNLILECKKHGFDTCATFIANAQSYAFVLARTTKDNQNTSLTERSMRTIKQRTRYAVWSDRGAENVIKIRLNHFYNDPNAGLHFGT